MTAAVRLLRLTAKCPTCGAPPKLRAFPSSQDLFDGADPEHDLLSYECHVRTCGEVYRIKVKDFVDAA